VVSAPVRGDTLYVDDDSSCTSECGSAESPFPSITQAVEQAGPGDTIVVLAGVYLENVTVTVPLSLVSSGGAIVSALTPRESVILIDADDVTVSGLEITGATSSSSSWVAGIEVVSGATRRRSWGTRSGRITGACGHRPT
jgi:nitrous oxidase accessory protein NosD